MIDVGGFIDVGDGAGSGRIERSRRDSALFAFRGHLSDAVAVTALEALDEMIADAAPFASFIDWSAMTGYDSAARSRMTTFVLTHRKRFRVVAILTGSTIAAMGVNVANVALGGFLTAMTDRSAFEALRRDHTR